MLNQKWKGQDNLALKKFIAQHHSAFVSMHKCSEHVQHQLPHKITQVSYLLNAIKSHTAPLQAAMTNIGLNDGPHGKMKNFELALAYLLLHNPVAAMKSSHRKGRQHANISNTTTSFGGMKVGNGKTRVEVQYFAGPEYRTLSKE